MKLSTEVELVQNSAICAIAVWTFVNEFYGESRNTKGPALPFVLPVLPLVLNREAIDTLSRRHYVGGLHLALAENRALTIDLQERMEGTVDLTFMALNIGFASKLLRYDAERGQLIPGQRKTAFQFQGDDVRDILNTAKRLGYWFYNINADQLCSMLRVSF